MKNFKKVLSLILVLALLLPGMAFANELNEEVYVEIVENEATRDLTKEEQTAVDEIRKLIQDIIEENGELKDLEEDYSDEEIVRIIVELEEKPVIVHANESGQRYEDMSYSQRTNIESKVYAAQEAVKNQIAARNIPMIYGRSFNTVFSGFSGEVKFADIEDIENIPGVKKVYISNKYERPEVKPDMDTSHEMIGSHEVWEDIGYKGEGMVIAIIDSGVDPYHKDFKLSKETLLKIKEEDLEKIEGLKGKFFTDKVPYGFNYFDQNHEILDKGPGASEHGMHVAGTAVANGEIKGVAPEAQVLAMKVFGNDPLEGSTYDDIYLEAIDEAVKLKADVLNMSLGSSSAFYIENSAVDVAITNAVKHGIVCSISAGNSGYTYYGWDETNYGLPFKEDPDYGVVGSPGLSKDSIQVASIEKLKLKAPYLQYTIPNVEGVLPVDTIIIDKKAYDILTFNSDIEALQHFTEVFNDYFEKDRLNEMPVYMKFDGELYIDAFNNPIDRSILPEIVEYRYTDENGERQSGLYVVLPDTPIGDGETGKITMAIAGSIAPRDIFGDNPVKYVDCGIGVPEDFDGKDLDGKIALIIRGGLTFVEKIMNAQNAGAAAVIVYNNEGGGEELINMQYPEQGEIPAVFIGHKGGMKLVEAGNAYLTFPEDEILAPNPDAGKMADSSSWGTTPTLELKPEITAPGRFIYSTLQYDNYGTMSGTSMAAPHVAGGAALVQQYIKNHEKYKELSLNEQARLAKVLLMNTAAIATNPESQEKTPFSPRRQGAGVMNVRAAVTTPVYIVNSVTNEAKVELKDFNSKTITMNLKAINDSEEALTYNVEVDVLADYIYPGLDLNLLESRNVDADISITDDGKITIPANGEKEFTVTIDFSKDEDIYENMFIEGFVKLTETTDNKPAISIPYVGFYGDWNKPRILDAMYHEIDEDTRAYYEWSYMRSQGVLGDYGLDYEDIFAISPGTDDGEAFGTDSIVPVLSFLRNAEKVEYNILDEDYNKIRTIRNENFVRKNLFDNGRRNPYTFNRARTWDGKARGKIVDDGLYYYQIKTKIHNGEWQEKNIPVYVDTEGPIITDIEYNEETGMLSWTATDEVSGVAKFLIFVNDDSITSGYINPKDIKVEGKEGRYEYNIKEFVEDLPTERENAIEIGALDHAWNTGFGLTVIGEGGDVPYIYLLEPETFDVFNKPDVEFFGFVHKDSKVLKSVKINGEEAFFMPYKELPVIDGDDFVPGYIFEHTLKGLEDGAQQIKVEAESAGGKKFSLTRRFFVDTTKPELNVKVLERENYSSTAELEINMKDNFPVLKLFVFDSEEFNYDGFDTYLSFNEANETITVTVDLDTGQNVIPIKLVDIAGNETTDEIEIERTTPNDEESVKLDKEALKIFFAEGDSAESVTQDLGLPTMGEYLSEITWASSNEDVINNEGKVTRQKDDVTVTLTATISKGEANATKEFTVTVKAVDKTKLAAKIEETGKLEERLYTEESWETFAQALAYAKTVFENEEVTQAEVDQALVDLTNAIEGLVRLTVEEIITKIEGKYGAIEENEKQIYVAYILFNIKEGFVETDEDVVVLIDGVELEMKDGKEDYDYRFEGMLEGEPTEVIIKIGDLVYDVTELFTWNEGGEANIETFIEIYKGLQNR